MVKPMKSLAGSLSAIKMFINISTSTLPITVLLLFLTTGLQNGSNLIAALISQEEWDIHNMAKRMDIAMCTARFDSHTDTLIKTKESLQMGAKFIADAELGSHDQCLRLCCETDNCDVFIFEEHAHGSCFLFECGRPSDFRCKFVPHANYTSGILDMSRRISIPQTPPPPPQLAPVLPTIKPHAVLSEHEMDLDKLRVKTSRKKGITTTTAIPPLGIRVADITTKAAPVVPKVASNCSRFQFQCRNGECIAIYDACNGIPQCKDGSDEGKECPGGPVEPKADTQQPSYNLPIPIVKVPLQKNYQNDGDDSSKGILPDSQLMVPRNREDPMSAPNIWQQRSNDNPYNGIDGESHIFSHKNGLQLPATNINSQYSDHMRDYSAVPHEPYLSVGDLYQSQQQQQLQPQQGQQSIAPQVPPSWFTDQQRSSNRYGWQQSQLLPQQDLALQKPYGQQQVLPQSQQNWPPAPPPPPPQQQQVPVQSPESPSVDTKAVPDVSVSKSDSASEEEDEDENESDTTTPEPKHGHKKKKPKSHRKEHDTDNTGDKVYAAQYKMIRNQLDMEFPDHDGMSDRPSGAVLSLTLGVIITAALAILIGCRVRVAGRRLRRHLPKGSGNYDADFLVNGMYL